MVRVRSRAALATAAAVLVVGLAACGGQAATASGPAAGPAAPGASVDPNAAEVNAAGDIPDNQVFVPYTPPGAPFRVSVPEGWARTTDGAATVFTDRFNAVRMEVVPRPAAPTAASARAEEVPALAGLPGFTLGDVTDISRKGGPAVLVTYTATSPADAVTGKSVTVAVERYEFWKGGQEVVLTLTGPKGADNVDPWRTVSDSFGWL